MSDCNCGLYKQSCGSTWRFCARYGGDEFVVIYENISKEDAKRICGGASPQGYGADSATPVFKDAAYCHNHTGHVLRCTKGRKQSVGFLHVADEILYSVKTDNRGSCRVVDRAEFMLMSGYGTTIRGAGRYHIVMS